RMIEARAYRSARRSEPTLKPRPASVEVEVLTPGILGENPDADLPDSIRTMLEHTVEFARTTVSDVMVRRSTMACLPATVSARDAARAFSETGYSRLPLYGEGRDDIVGVLYAKDLWSRLAAAPCGTDISPREIAHPPMIIPETKNAAQLLDEFRAQQVQIAIVVDEWGVVSGLVTLEDLLEQIVGPIEDEFDPQPIDPLRPLGGRAYEVDGTYGLEDLNEKLDLRLPTDDDFATVGGLAFHELGRVPEPGETFRVDGVVFTVLEVAEHSIRRLRMELDPDPQDAPGYADRNGGRT
ncbi:MAG: hemolysin family protein, partial [Isosphaeraceae bacterium]